MAQLPGELDVLLSAPLATVPTEDGWTSGLLGTTCPLHLSNGPMAVTGRSMG